MENFIIYQNFIEYYIRPMQPSIEKINTQIFSDFLPHLRLIRTIGEGAFAQVHLIYDER